jgi:acetyl esterase/lipase
MIRVALITQEMAVPLPINPSALASGDTIREEVVIEAPDTRYRAVAVDLYRPRDGEAHGTLVLAIGAADQIRDHPAVIRLSNAVARAGIVVAVPEMEYPLRDRETLPEDVRLLTGAFSSNVEGVVATVEWLREQEFVDREEIAMVGFSAGGGIAVMAAADERINEDVSFVVTLGAYYDMMDLISSITTGTVTYEGATSAWEPRVSAARIMHRSIISLLPNAVDREVLGRIYIEEDTAALTRVWEMTEDGRALHEAFASKDAARLQELWRAISPQDAAVLDAISPSMHVSGLRADLYVLSDEDDDYIPHVESLRLRDAAAVGDSDVHYLGFDAFDHVEPEGLTDPLGLLGDTSKLMHMTWRLLMRLQ